jgi:hypothetical protein
LVEKWIPPSSQKLQKLVKKTEGILGVKNFLDNSATVDTSFPADCSDSGSSSLFDEIFERRSSKSRCCSDDSMSTSS